MTTKNITCWGSVPVEGAGASQMQRGIPHLHSLISDTGLFPEVGVFGHSFASMSSLEIVSVILFTPSAEDCDASFADLCQIKDVTNVWLLNRISI